MKNRTRICSLLLALLGLSGVANAGSIVAQLGDEDGFNLGTLADETFPLSFLPPDDGDGTDLWVLGTQTFTLSYDVSGLGTITAASLEVFAGGLGWLGIGSLHLDGDYVGQLTDGDIDATLNNYARLDIFNVLPFSSSFDGNTSVTNGIIL